MSEGQYYELALDFVTEIPLLALPLGERREMPPLCCACDAASIIADFAAEARATKKRAGPVASSFSLVSKKRG